MEKVDPQRTFIFLRPKPFHRGRHQVTSTELDGRTHTYNLGATMTLCNLLAHSPPTEKSRFSFKRFTKVTFTSSRCIFPSRAMPNPHHKLITSCNKWIHTSRMTKTSFLPQRTSQLRLMAIVSRCIIIVTGISTPLA